MNGTDLLERLKTALADRYAIEREVGSGGMAVVFLADDLKHGRKVALKVLRPELAHAIGPDRFLSEIQITARLDHPHILPLLDSGEADGFLYFVMPFVEGETLRDRLDREGQLEVDDGIQVTGEVAAALAYAHERGVVHRDLKPGNILLQHGLARLADFGIAHAVGEAGGDRLTVTGMSVGTPAYMSPEQAAGDPDVDARSDIYSLACVTFEMLTGEPPFTGTSARTVLGKHIGEPAPRLSGPCPEAGPAVEAALARAFEKEPADRQTTAAEFADDLKTGASERAARKRRRIALAATAILLVGAIGAYVGLRDRVNFAGPPAARTGPPAIAVMPFNASGEGTETWLEGVVPLMAANLDGVPGLEAISPGTVLAEWRVASPDGQAPSREMALEIARVTGASYAVTGGAVAAGDGLRFTAEIHDVESGAELIKTRAEGPADSALALIDEVALQLIETIASGDMTDLPIVNFDRIDTRSVEALKAYLVGEEARHDLEFERALEAYQRSAAEDSLFGQAWLRVAQAVSLVGGSPGETRPVRVEAIQRFRALAPEAAEVGLTPRERLEARQAYVTAHPEDADAWWRVGRLMSTGLGPRLGVPADDIRYALERASTLAPDSRYYKWTLTDFLFHIERDSALMAGLVGSLRGEDETSQAYLEARLRFDLVFGDSAFRAQAIAGFDTLTVDAQQGVVQEAALHPRDPELFEAWLGARRSLERELGEGSGRDAELGHRIVFYGLGRGRLAETQDLLRDPKMVSLGQPYRWAMVFSRLGLPMESDIRDELTVEGRFSGPTLLAVDEGRWNDFASDIGSWRAKADSLDAAGDPWAWHLAFQVDAIEAYGQWRQGDPESAEAVLVSHLDKGPDLEGWSPIVRWWLAEIYVDLGRPEDALRYLGTYWRPEDVIWLPLARYESGKILESLGRYDEALAAYAEFLEYWQDADPSVQFMLDDARQRAEALAVEVG